VLADTIRQTIGEKIALVDSAQTTAAAVAEALDDGGLAAEGGTADGQTIRFFATDSPERFARVGAIFLGRAIDEGDVELVDLLKA
jgi:glutamate racemase